MTNSNLFSEIYYRITRFIGKKRVRFGKQKIRFDCNPLNHSREFNSSDNACNLLQTVYVSSVDRETYFNQYLIEIRVLGIKNIFYIKNFKIKNNEKRIQLV